MPSSDHHHQQQPRPTSRSGAAGGGAPVASAASLLGAGGSRRSRGRSVRARSRRLAQDRDARGIDPTRARPAVLGLKPDHAARVRAPKRRRPGRAGSRGAPSAAAPRAPAASRRARRSRCRGRRRPPTTRAGTAPRIARRAAATDRGSRVRAIPPTPAGHRRRDAAGAIVRASAAASAARGHFRCISSPEQSSVYRPTQTPAEGLKTAARFQPGRSSREMNGTGPTTAGDEPNARNRQRSTPPAPAPATGRRPSRPTPARRGRAARDSRTARGHRHRRRHRCGGLAAGTPPEPGSQRLCAVDPDQRAGAPVNPHVEASLATERATHHDRGAPT